MKTRLLNERAFAPASMPLPAEGWLSSLYPEAPEYGRNLPQGTVKNLEEFTFAERSIVDTLNHQFSLLIENIKERCQALGIEDEELFENIETFEAQYIFRIYYVFYAQIKESLEAIAFDLSNNSSLISFILPERHQRFFRLYALSSGFFRM
ncbi:MAG: hypothetical protein K0S63_1327 [Gammaproteobacteria bacterium]|nr:hypothetical protein [Gammaproteobacteria bacterium]